MHCVSTALEGSPIQNDQVMMLLVEKEKKKIILPHCDSNYPIKAVKAATAERSFLPCSARRHGVLYADWF
jgi:hypothetical protein